MNYLSLIYTATVYIIIFLSFACFHIIRHNMLISLVVKKNFLTNKGALIKIVKTRENVKINRRL